MNDEESFELFSPAFYESLLSLALSFVVHMLYGQVLFPSAHGSYLMLFPIVMFVFLLVVWPVGYVLCRLLSKLHIVHPKIAKYSGTVLLCLNLIAIVPGMFLGSWRDIGLIATLPLGVLLVNVKNVAHGRMF